MSFSRINPAGWAVNSKLTSAEQNALDIDHANALDKYGDELLGDLDITSGARILVDSGGKIANLSGGVWESQSGSHANYLSGSFLTVNIGATLGVSGALALTNASFAANAGSTFTTNCSLNANGGVNATTGFFSGVLTCYNNLVMDGTGVAGAIKMRIIDATYLDMETAARQRFFSGTTLEMQSGSTSSFSGTHNFQSGSACVWATSSTASWFGTSTYGISSTLTHASGSTETYASGGSLIQNAGSSWSLSGAQTLLSGATWTANAGSVLAINSTPSFNNGISVTAGNAIFIGASTVLGSPTTTLTTAGARLKLASRSVTRIYCPAGANIDGGTAATRDVASGGITITAVQALILPFTPPDNSTLTNVTIVWGAPGGTCSVAASLWKNTTQIGTTVSGTAASGAFSIPVSEVISATTNHYRMVLQRTGGSFPLTWVTAQATFTVSEYAEA